jgi:Flp pilus assembly protein CpaB
LFARKLSGKSKVQLAAAALCAAIAFLLVQGYTSSLQALDPGGLVDVLTVTSPLSRGATLRETDIAVVRRPANFLPPGALASTSDAIGRALGADLAEGEVVTRTRLTSAAGPVAALVPDGLRAMAVATDLPEGILAAGDRVDLVATYGGGQPWSEIVASQIEVLDVLPPGSGAITDGPSGMRLLLLVDPNAAQEIAHAKAFATIEAVVVGAAGTDASG